MSAETVVVHECTSYFMREILPENLDQYQWAWPSRDGLVQEATEEERRVRSACLDLSPCFFGWPCSRERCYSVPSSILAFLRFHEV